MTDKQIIGVDLGATNVRGAVVDGQRLQDIHSCRIHREGSVDEVLGDIFGIIDPLVTPDIAGIGIGVPSVVDVGTGTVYDVIHIPSWKEVPLGRILQERYKLPVHVNNDANCFALGELYFGKGKGQRDFIGLTIGTGLGAGIIINQRLYAGPHCGAGEFGMVDYLDHCYEYYASGQFFRNVHGVDGEEVFRKATEGDAHARSLYAEMGMHLGKAIKMMLYTYDPSLIIFGGSVRHAYAWFQETMWTEIRKFAFGTSGMDLRIASSELENSGILGAAGLYYDRSRDL